MVELEGRKAGRKKELTKTGEAVGYGVVGLG